MKLFCVYIIVFAICSFTCVIALKSDKSLTEFEKMQNNLITNSNSILKAAPGSSTPKPLNGTKVRPVKNVKVRALLGDVYWEGWVKYFHYDYDIELKKPNSFFRNPAYSTQKTKNRNLLMKDLKNRNQNIPGPHHFWAKLLATGNLNILSNRKLEDTNLADSLENLNTDTIKYVHPGDNASGAIKDLGSFSEGHCISISTLKADHIKNDLFSPSKDDGEDETWIICTEDEEQKKKLMSYLVSMKLKRQANLKEIQLDKKQNKKFKYASQLFKPPNLNPQIKRGGPSANDGYLILLQDWSPCSVKCGGGISTKQWMCVPPKNKGKPCPGDVIEERKCNLKPCPRAPGVLFSNDQLNNEKDHVTLKPIYIALPFSARPQNYVECVIKESDVLYATKEYDPEQKNKVKVPARMVMNPNTISVFRDDGYTTALFVFNLKDTQFSTSVDDHCCFYLTNQNREQELCDFDNNCGTKQDPKFVNSWKNDIDFFIQKCQRPLQETDLNRKPGKKRPPGIPQGPLGSGSGEGSGPQQQILKKKRAIIKKKISDSLQLEMDKKVDQTQKISMNAIRREINLEDLIKNEEIEKGRGETQELEVQVEQEKKKKQLLDMALKTREQSYSEIRLAKNTRLKMDDIKQDTKMDIKFKRGVLKKKIEEIRHKFKRKQRVLQQQIMKIRSEMANEIMEANKNGNYKICIKSRNDISKIKDYCDLNEPTDFVKNTSCKEPENFCYICCEIEYGNMFIAEREDCQTKCDEETKKDLENGDWIWTTGL